MSRKKWFYIGFFVILFIGFYVALTMLMPGFGKEHIPPVSFVRPFRFTDQDGKAFTEKDVEGKIYVAEYFFTTCTGICPRMNNKMKQVYEKFRNEPDFLILSHTCNPGQDSSARLKHYADSMQVDTKKWVFLTGRKDSLYTMARISYTIDDPKNNLRNIEDDFLHTQFWALVDRNGDVKKIYDGLKDSEVNELMDDVAKMLKDKK